MGRHLGSRADRFNRTPLIRATIGALIDVLAQAQTRDIGNALVVNVNGALALELSLKLLYLTFHDELPPSTHSLRQLWSGLPQDWRIELNSRYRSRKVQPSDIRVFGLQVAVETPDPPAEGLSMDMSSADGLFEAISDQFVRSRYMYETLADEEWTYVVCGKSPMLLMLRVLSEFYDEKLQ